MHQGTPEQSRHASRGADRDNCFHRGLCDLLYWFQSKVLIYIRGSDKLSVSSGGLTDKQGRIQEVISGEARLIFT